MMGPGFSPVRTLTRVRSLAVICSFLLVLVTGCGEDDPDPAGSTAASDSATASETAPEPTSESTPASGAPSEDALTYVALGDSYTAAAGVPEIVDEGCSRSSSNYPSLLAEELGLTLTDVSCGGATTTSLVGVQETSTGPVPPQFAALTPETDVVTLGIGGNDQGLFGELLATCLMLRDDAPGASPCRDTFNADGEDRALATIDIVQERVTSALIGIRDRAPDARIVLVGYPQLAPAKGRCDLLPLSPGDYSYAREIIDALGAATEAAAEAAEVDYVDMLAASEGHDICAGEDAWVNGVGGPTDQAAGMHPFAEEQQAVADLLAEALRD
jgi:lysophospholipase L1-like esterase